MKILRIIVLLIVAGSLKAEGNQDIMIYFNGDTLSGVIEYHWKKGLLTIKSEGLTRAFGPQQITKFEYFDQKLGVKKYFSAIKNKNESRYQFYEILIQGSVGLIRQQRSDEKEVDVYYTPFDKNKVIVPEQFTYYLVIDSNLRKVKNFRKTLSTELGAEIPGITKFVRNKYPSHSSMVQNFLIIREYNIQQANLKIPTLSLIADLIEP